MCIRIHVMHHIYIYIYREREREKERNFDLFCYLCISQHGPKGVQHELATVGWELRHWGKWYQIIMQIIMQIIIVTVMIYK